MKNIYKMKTYTTSVLKQFFTRLKLFALCILLLDATNVFGQSPITIGTGTTEAYIPIDPYYGYTYSQSIYLQSELGGPKTITTLSFYYSYSTGLTASNTWVIYIGHTTKTGITSNTDWVPVSSMTSVYSGTFTSPTAAGWITFDISDFAYNGTDKMRVPITVIVIIFTQAQVRVIAYTIEPMPSILILHHHQQVL